MNPNSQSRTPVLISFKNFSFDNLVRKLVHIPYVFPSAFLFSLFIVRFQVDETISPTTSVSNVSTKYSEKSRMNSFDWIEFSNRRLSQVSSSKPSLINPKQQIRHHEENHSMNKTLPVDLDSYLSKRRYTIGGVSSTKILDLKSISNGNPSQHSNNRMSFESKWISHWIIEKFFRL